jgi:large subunit ribosomal protein L7/L12
MAMTCKLCGTEIKENETVCSLCGTAVENTSATVEEKPAPAVEETPAPVVEEVKPAPVAPAAPAVAEVKPAPVVIQKKETPKFVCSGCGKEYPAGTKFCAECGGKVEEMKPAAPVVFACTGCGKEYPAGTKFCAECGGKVEEVKPAAPVVFACVGCGKEYPEGIKFCSECGGKVAAKGVVVKAEKETVSSIDSTLYNIYLQDCGNNKIAVIKEIRRVTGSGLKEAKDLAESLPACLKKGCSAEEAEEIKKQLEASGASVKIAEN